MTGQPMGAIVSLGGCSASFVSPDGLIATNHHCVQGALQYNSTPERNLIEDGWLAKTRADELWNGPGSRVYVTTRVREVTNEILGKLSPRLSDLDRQARIERRQKELLAKCEKPGTRCTVASFFEGARWFEITQDELEDVRLVYAPPASIGNFGGETDNWMWPRHTGDWSFYRAYVGKDGKPAPYSKDNVPYQPKRFLKVSTKGASEGELVIVAGYPGRTKRLKTYAEVKEQLDWSYPRTVRRYREMLGILDGIGDADPNARIAVATRVRGLANTMKNHEGVLEGAAREGLLAQKKQAEADLLAWIEADPKRRAAFGGVLPQLDALQAKQERTRERDATFEALFYNSSVLGSARTILRLAENRAKPDVERDLGYQARDFRRIRDTEERKQRSLAPVADRALLRYAMLEAAALPADQRIQPLDRAIGLVPGQAAADAAKRIDAYLDGLYAGTKLFDRETRLGLLEKSRKDVL
ncbi:MAG TPA: S46 family peptidase, partial [Anaeromyxobacteraceae bacterium]|nr:S46 family peptidase [Anaeromyxobacteraceae bacterium]